MRAISVRQPWAWLITQGQAIQPPKVAEFRSWTVGYKGWLLIHASRTRDAAGWTAARLIAEQHDVELPAVAEVATGGIVGAARLVECVEHHDCPWFYAAKTGNTRSALVLADATPVAFVPWKGAQGLFDIPLARKLQALEPEAPLPAARLRQKNGSWQGLFFHSVPLRRSDVK